MIFLPFSQLKYVSKSPKSHFRTIVDRAIPVVDRGKGCKYFN